MVDSDYYKAAWKMLDAISAQYGVERVLYISEWHRQCVRMVKLNRTVTPETYEIELELEGLIRAGRLKTRIIDGDKIGITIFAPKGENK